MGQAVYGAIVAADLTQAQAAEAAGMALNTLSRRINGHLPFTWPEVARLAGVTGLTISELVASAERIYGRTDAA
jgi:transcriptional regulator with XRE-family HTH domain